MVDVRYGVLLVIAVAFLGCDKIQDVAQGKSSKPESVDVSGKWTCMFSNTTGSAVNESVIFVPDGSTAKVSATGRDANFNHYSGNGTGTLKNGEWNVTFNWNNGATPTWIRVKPSANGKTMAGRRGKFDDKKYEGDYNCTKD